ncbi:hypothetical protein B0H13DRAFT_1914089 [Mycena leptocephala]|nr:hypothetical protein B0H13DRAFT_1914089 [Mycena leptocephala]
MFEAAGNISQGDIKAYRRFAFPPALGDSTHDPFFSVENAPDWITSPVGSWDTDNATPTQVRSYRNCMVGESYLHHPFFSLDNSESWISLLAFQAYMDTFHGSFDMYRTRHSTPVSSRAPSCAPSSIGSRAPSRAGSSFSALESRPSSRASIIPSSHAPSSRSSSPLSFANSATVISDDEHSPLATLAPPLMAPMLERASPLPPVAAVTPSAKKRKGKQKAGQPGIRLTRELAVDEIVPISTIPATWTVPRIHTAYLVDLHDSQELLKVGKRMVTIDGFIRAEDQDSWGGSGGHSKGDVHTAGFMPDSTESILCRRSHLYCNGIFTCEFSDQTIFADCKRYEPDEEAMRALWTLELEANEREAASAPGKIARHRYLPFPDNMDLNTVRFAMQNNGRLPGPPLTLNEKFPLTVHPRIGKGLQHCLEQLNPDIQKALIFLRNPHNHPAHPKTKPSANDKLTLGKAVEAAGIVGLTAQRLLNASSTALVYTGERVAAVSPAFMDNRRVRSFIDEQKKKEYPRGMGWDGVLHHLSTKEPSLLESERYIHTAMSKNGFRLVVTMHPQIASHIHSTLALNIDFTFKRVDGEMNEWEVAGMSDRFNRRLTFGSLFCDTASTEAFMQLFIELFDTIAQVTGKPLKLAPFFPDANCRIVILDGEVPQVLGLGHFLAIYNNPVISGHNPIELLSHCLKTCEIHFERHIDELPRDIPRTVIHRLKSITDLTTQAELDGWHEFCASQSHIDIKNWYAHKLANTWVLTSVNKCLSKISDENWDITPNQSNIVETAHAGRNAETSIGVGLLTAILEFDALLIRMLALYSNIMSDLKHATMSGLQSSCRFNVTVLRVNDGTGLGIARNLQLSERGKQASLDRQKQLEAEIKLLQEEMKIERHRSDLREKVTMLRREIDEEKAGRREWVLRRAEIDSELAKLRGGPLAGVRINGRRPAERPLDNAQTAPDESLIENEEDADLSGGVETETDSSLNFQVEPAGTDVTDILHYKHLPQRSERQIWDSSFDISSFLSSSADVLDSIPQFQQPGITDNDLGLNPYIPTEEFLSYLDNPEFLERFMLITKYTQTWPCTGYWLRMAHVHQLARKSPVRIELGP